MVIKLFEIINLVTKLIFILIYLFNFVFVSFRLFHLNWELKMNGIFQFGLSNIPIWTEYSIQIKIFHPFWLPIWTERPNWCTWKSSIDKLIKMKKYLMIKLKFLNSLITTYACLIFSCILIWLLSTIKFVDQLHLLVLLNSTFIQLVSCDKLLAKAFWSC